MANKTNDQAGLMSSAGIMRYFDAEDSAIKLDPKTVVAFAIVLGAIVMGLNYIYGRLW